MGVYIKDMEMPMVCGACPFCLQAVSNDMAYCLAGGPCERLNIDTRHPHCPLIPVPDHGDLIDRNMLIGGFADWYIQESPMYLGDDNTVAETIGDAIKAIEAAPIVIPAERSEE